MEFPPPTERFRFRQLIDQNKIGEDQEFMYLDPIPCVVKSRGISKRGFIRSPFFHQWGRQKAN